MTRLRSRAPETHTIASCVDDRGRVWVCRSSTGGKTGRGCGVCGTFVSECVRCASWAGMCERVVEAGEHASQGSGGDDSQ